MKTFLQSLLADVLVHLHEKNIIPSIDVDIQLDFPKEKSHGDVATNLALVLAKSAKKNPREVAQLIVDAISENDQIKKIEIAGPGFINFFLNADATALTSPVTAAYALSGIPSVSTAGSSTPTSELPSLIR